MIILEIPNIPNRLRSIDTDNIKNKMDPGAIRKNIYRVKNESRIPEIISKVGVPEIYRKEESDGSTIFINDLTQNKQLREEFTSEEKERTIFLLQIISGAFLVVSILYIFGFLTFAIYSIVGVLLIGFTLYLLFKKVKLMYSDDFNAYRDFFLMYISVGLILIIMSYNPDFMIALPFPFLPSLSVLIFAVILVVAIFLIFRIRYHRNYTYGRVIEAGKKTAYVKVDYDICSSVKPDIYLVKNEYGANEGDAVKLKVEEKLISTGGNKPISIIEVG